MAEINTSAAVKGDNDNPLLAYLAFGEKALAEYGNDDDGEPAVAAESVADDDPWARVDPDMRAKLEACKTPDAVKSYLECGGETMGGDSSAMPDGFFEFAAHVGGFSEEDVRAFFEKAGKKAPEEDAKPESDGGNSKAAPEGGTARPYPVALKKLPFTMSLEDERLCYCYWDVGLPLVIKREPGNVAEVVSISQSDDGEISVSFKFTLAYPKELLIMPDRSAYQRWVADTPEGDNEVDIDRADATVNGKLSVAGQLMHFDVSASESGQKCLNAISAESRKLPRVRAVKMPGWQPTGFMCPSASWFPRDEKNVDRVELLKNGPKEWLTLGDVPGWTETTRVSFLEANDHDALGVIAGFASVLMEPLGVPSAALFFSGESSTGKSTAQEQAAAVWGTWEKGDNSLFRSLNATENAFEYLFPVGNHVGLHLDELNMVKCDIQQLIFMISQGTGKGRGARQGGIRDTTAWRLLVTLSGETALGQKLREAGITEAGGLAARVITINVDDRKDLSRDVLDRLTGYKKHFGVAGPAFIKWLLAEEIDFEGVKDRMDEITAKLSEGLSNVDSRSAQLMALNQVTGELLQQAGLIPGADEYDVGGLYRRVWDKYQAAERVDRGSNAERAVAALRQALISREGGTVVDIADHTKVGGAPKKAWIDYQKGEIYLPLDELVDLAGGFATEAQLRKQFEEEGVLVPDTDRWYHKRIPHNVGAIKHCRLDISFLRPDNFSDEREEKIRAATNRRDENVAVVNYLTDIVGSLGDPDHDLMAEGTPQAFVAFLETEMRKGAAKVIELDGVLVELRKNDQG